MILRCPMVPGVNDIGAHFEAIASLARENPAIRHVDILPYHSWGRGKPMPLWCDHWGLNLPTADEEDILRWTRSLVPFGSASALQKTYRLGTCTL